MTKRPPDGWRVRPFRDRPLVLMACGWAETDRLQKAWGGHAIDVLHCPDLTVALVHIGHSGPNLILVGDTEGVLGPVDFLLALRQVDTDIPVVIGLDDAWHNLGAKALAAGATAVVPRPFSPADVMPLLYSSPQGGTYGLRPMPIDLGRLRVDHAATRIWIDGVESFIPQMEYKLLRYLAERHGQIVTRDELVTAAWGAHITAPSNSLNVHLARIRRRFPADSGKPWIRPIRGIGYKLSVPQAPSDEPICCSPDVKIR